MKEIHYTRSNDIRELQQIKQLQEKNLLANVSLADSEREGFVTLSHDLQLLEKMNTPHPHFIAKVDDQVIGYTLVMECRFKKDIPLLIDMFAKITSCSYEGTAIKENQFFVMGQVCVDKAYRGQGVFKKLYTEMAKCMSTFYAFIITEVSSKNKRSMYAHESVGFVKLLTYPYRKDEDWIIYILDIRN